MSIIKLDYKALWDGICNWSRKVGRATAPKHREKTSWRFLQVLHIWCFR